MTGQTRTGAICKVCNGTNDGTKGCCRGPLVHASGPAPVGLDASATAEAAPSADSFELSMVICDEIDSVPLDPDELAVFVEHGAWDDLNAVLEISDESPNQWVNDRAVFAMARQTRSQDALLAFTQRRSVEHDELRYVLEAGDSTAVAEILQNPAVSTVTLIDTLYDRRRPTDRIPDALFDLPHVYDVCDRWVDADTARSHHDQLHADLKATIGEARTLGRLESLVAAAVERAGPTDDQLDEVEQGLSDEFGIDAAYQLRSNRTQLQRQLTARPLDPEVSFRDPTVGVSTTVPRELAARHTQGTER